MPDLSPDPVPTLRWAEIKQQSGDRSAAARAALDDVYAVFGTGRELLAPVTVDALTSTRSDFSCRT